MFDKEVQLNANYKQWDFIADFENTNKLSLNVFAVEIFN